MALCKERWSGGWQRRGAGGGGKRRGASSGAHYRLPGGSQAALDACSRARDSAPAKSTSPVPITWKDHHLCRTKRIRRTTAHWNRSARRHFSRQDCDLAAPPQMAAGPLPAPSPTSGLSPAVAAPAPRPASVHRQARELGAGSDRWRGQAEAGSRGQRVSPSFACARCLGRTLDPALFSVPAGRPGRPAPQLKGRQARTLATVRFHRRGCRKVGASGDSVGDRRC